MTTYLQQVATTGATPPVTNIVLLKTQKVKQAQFHMYCEAQRMVCLGFSRLGILIQLTLN